MVLCIHNSVISTRNTSLYLSQPSSVVFASKTATFGPELQVSMGPTPHLLFSAYKTSWLASEWLGSMGLSPHLWFLHPKRRLLDQNYKFLCVPDLTCCFPAYKTAWLASELLGSKGPSPHLWLLLAKQRLLDQNYKSLLVPDLTCRFLHAKHRDQQQKN